MDITIKVGPVQFTMDQEPVTIVTVVTAGPSVLLGPRNIDTTQTALSTRAGATNWGDAECRDEAVAWWTAQGFTTTLE
jgi:hypothetical protein